MRTRNWILNGISGLLLFTAILVANLAETDMWVRDSAIIAAFSWTTLMLSFGLLLRDYRDNQDSEK